MTLGSPVDEAGAPSPADAAAGGDRGSTTARIPKAQRRRREAEAARSAGMPRGRRSVRAEEAICQCERVVGADAGEARENEQRAVSYPLLSGSGLKMEHI